jgi:DNA-binding transcriptional LysR family regulator
MGQIEDQRAFVRIVELESIGKAAEQVGIAKSAMSRKLRLLEERMQTALIIRTTRQWSLTEAGRQYYERGVGVLQAVDEFESCRSDMRTTRS